MHKLLESKGYKKRNGQVFRCDFCKKEVYKGPFHSKNFDRHFCNMECKLTYQRASGFSFDCLVCGKKVKTQPAQIKLRNRKTCSIQCRSKLSAIRAEERHVSGKLTKHQIDRSLRYSKRASDWRMAVFKRDNFICQFCKNRGGYLEADHIKPWAYFPKLRFELSNGRTLCRKCHDKTKISYKEMRKKWALAE